MTATDAADTELDRTAARLDEAMAAVTALDPQARATAQSAIDALNDLHKQALVTLVRTLKADDRGRDLLFDVVDDPGVRMVLAIHSIIRTDPSTAVQQALDQVRPALQSHGGNVEFSHVQDGVAYVRLQGACNGCSMAAVTMRQSVEEAVTSAVPGITAVEVLPNDPAPTVISVESLLQASRTGLDPDVAALREAGWADAGAIDGVEHGRLVAVTLTAAGSGAAISAIVINLSGQFQAFENACAHQGRPLDDAIIDADAGTLTCPWHGLCYAADSGECLTLPGAQLAPLPVQLAGGRIWVRPGS